MMKSTFELIDGDTGVVLPIEINHFPGGEVNVSTSPVSGVKYVLLTARLRDTAGIVALMMLHEAIVENYPRGTVIGLALPYIPFARQDRRCNPGEAFSLKVFTNLINSMNFKTVVVVDPHSDVAPALINNVKIITQDKVVQGLGLDLNNYTLVSPDFGATKKTEKLAGMCGKASIIQGVKRRDPRTGTLTGFGVYGNVSGKNCLIVDDICDGGGTFLGLSNKLYEAGAKSVDLFVTHGIFSHEKGAQLLLDNGIGTIYTTDSYYTGTNTDRIKVIEL